MAKTIYIVDDNADIVYSIKDGLSLLNPDFQFESANSSTEALLKIHTYKAPDLIILDIMLPDMSGLDLAEKLRSHPELKKTPILFLTAKIDDSTRKKARFLSKHFLNKPFEIEELNKLVKKII